MPAGPRAAEGGRAFGAPGADGKGEAREQDVLHPGVEGGRDGGEQGVRPGGVQVGGEGAGSVGGVPVGIERPVSELGVGGAQNPLPQRQFRLA